MLHQVPLLFGHILSILAINLVWYILNLILHILLGFCGYLAPQYPMVNLVVDSKYVIFVM